MLGSRLRTKGRQLQEELDVCKLCLLMSFHKQRSERPGVDKWSHWTTASKQVEPMEFGEQKKLLHKLSLEQVRQWTALSRLTLTLAAAADYTVV